MILQKRLILSPKTKGFHLIDREINSAIKEEIKSINRGVAHIFIRHTSAALTINENADPTVREDFSTFFSRLVPENMALYKHIFEGADDMTAHIKASLLGASVTVPVKNGALETGTWQGIYLCEFRDRGGARELDITIIGE
jgi:secondary thiamine-phosphate synthase enzyme